jgi:hypothetical protein
MSLIFVVSSDHSSPPGKAQLQPAFAHLLFYELPHAPQPSPTPSYLCLPLAPRRSARYLAHLYAYNSHPRHTRKSSIATANSRFFPAPRDRANNHFLPFLIPYWKRAPRNPSSSYFKFSNALYNFINPVLFLFTPTKAFLAHQSS